jgi:predicted GNAT family N-acyltransferase
MINNKGFDKGGNDMNLKIRNADPEDLDRIGEIEKEAFPPAEAASKGKYSWRLEHYPQFFFVGELNGMVVGVVCIIPMALDVIKDEIFEMEELPIGKTAAVLSVMTSQDFRKQGVAENLLKYAMDKMGAYGMESACLTCKEHLIHYYAKFGFIKVGVSESVHGGAVWYDMVCKLK